MNVTTDRLLRRFAPVAAPRMRLFCIPHAGGAASAYRTWPARLPPTVEVVAVQLPGREDRTRELPHTGLRDAASAIVQAMRSSLDLPYVIFGHSLGALLAFETAAQLREAGDPDPSHVLFCSSRAPHFAATNNGLHRLPDEELRARVRKYDGIPAAIVQAPEFESIFLPIMRADFRLSETYVPPVRPPLSIAVSVVGGRGDPHVPSTDLTAWRDHCGGAFTVRLFAGGHFFLHDTSSGFLGAFSSLLERLSQAGSAAT